MNYPIYVVQGLFGKFMVKAIYSAKDTEILCQCNTFELANNKKNDLIESDKKLEAINSAL